MEQPIFVLPFTGYILLNTTCIVHFPTQQYNKSHVPDEKELTSICPEILKYLNCYRVEMQEVPADSREFGHKFYNSSGRFLRELCTNGTYAREAYLKSHECFKSLDENGAFGECSKEVEPMYEQLKDSPYLEPNGREVGKECFTERMKAGCVGHIVSELCEIVNYYRFTKFLQKSRFLDVFCGNTPVESVVPNYMKTFTMNLFRKIPMEAPIPSASVQVEAIQYYITALTLLLFLMYQLH